MSRWAKPLYWIDLGLEIIKAVIISGPSLLCNGQSSRLQIQRHRFDSRCYQVFWVVVGMEWGSTRPRKYSWGATWKKK
jgi:hypothetical protein